MSIRRILFWLFVGGLVIMLFTKPLEAANLVGRAGGAVITACESTATFVTASLTNISNQLG